MTAPYGSGTYGDGLYGGGDPTTTYLLDDMMVWLEANTEFVPGTDLFEGLVPQRAGTDTPDVVVSLFEYAGPQPDYTFGPATLPAIAHPRIQVITRGASEDYVTARNNCETIVRSLEQIVNTTVNTTGYLRVARLQEPFMAFRDAARRVFFSCNLEVMRIPS
jgi:hypothetical protein